jgi:outer membrane receptor protein involved in Fe transport
VIGHGFAAYANVGLNDANYLGSNAGKANATSAGYIGAVPNAPKYTYSLGELFNQGNWDESLLYKHIGTQCNTKLGTTGLCGATTHMPAIDNIDFNASYTFTALPTPYLKRLKLQLSVFNLTNRRTLIEADAPLATSQSQWEAPRSFMVSVKADF